MSSKVTFDYSKAAAFVKEHEIEAMKKIVEDAKDVLTGRNGAGNDFLGWIDLPVDYDKEEFSRIQKAAEKIKADSEVLIVIGIGGSYLGARAAIEFLRHNFYNMVPKEIRKTPEIYYAGNKMCIRDSRKLSANCRRKTGRLSGLEECFRKSGKKMRSAGQYENAVWVGGVLRPLLL